MIFVSYVRNYPDGEPVFDNDYLDGTIESYDDVQRMEKIIGERVTILNWKTF